MGNNMEDSLASGPTVPRFLDSGSWSGSWSAARFEAEEAELSPGVEVDNKHAGYTGFGFVDYKSEGPEAYIEWKLPISHPGFAYYDLKFRYACTSSNRPLSVTVNDYFEETVKFPSTGSWTRWKYTESVTVYLADGENYIRASATGNSGCNIDHVLLERVTSTNMFEAEEAELSSGVRVDNKHSGYTGFGFVDYKSK